MYGRVLNTPLWRSLVIQHNLLSLTVAAAFTKYIGLSTKQPERYVLIPSLKSN